MSHRILEWDSEHFGFPIARWEGTADFDTFEGWARERGVCCTYLLLDAGSTSEIARAVRNGFEFQDIRVTLSQDLEPTAEATPSGETRPCDSADGELLRARGPALFSESRFFRDKRFPREKVIRLYERWIEKALSPSNTQTVIVSGTIGKPTGLVTCEILPDHTGNIGLFAAFETHQGLGVKLLLHAMHWFRSQGVEYVTVVTQGTAIAAQRCYQKAGFRTASLALWFHRWSY